MVLEDVVSSRELMKHPLVMLFLALLTSSAGLWLSFLAFPESSSILGISFVTIALVPIMHSVFVKEERAEAESSSWSAGFIERHFTLIKIYSWFFVGLILSYAFWYAVLPTEIRQTVFEEQEKTLTGIQKLKSELTGLISLKHSPCNENMQCWFELIFYNNSIVLLLAVLLSFIYGAGAIFLIGWNASVIGVAVGKDILQAMAIHGNFPQAFAAGLYNGLGLLPHGLPEALGYFLGAIAGGMISVAVSKKKCKSHEFEIIAEDSIITLLMALALLFTGAAIEAWVIVQAI